MKECELNFLEHILNLTISGDLKWEQDHKYDKPNKFSAISKIEDYDIKVAFEKRDINRISLFFSFNYTGDKDLENTNLYISDISENEHSNQLSDLILGDNLIEWPVIKQTVIESFLDDTAKALIREKKIDSILGTVKKIFKSKDG
tara:strand:- start:13816 stop:14250 length:435 start_codon:yes stop_codon:yes gene_type:complete